jgi:hypothetical protein
MKIIDHGKWIPYKPSNDAWPEGAPAQALFAKRESDGVDWYDYVNPPKENRQRLFSENFREDSVKIAFMWHESEQRWKIGPSVIDATLIFPANQIVREIIGFGTTDEDEIIARLRSRYIDPETNEITDPPPPRKMSEDEAFVMNNLAEVIVDLRARVQQLEKARDDK